MKFTLVVAATEELGIGVNANLPWRIPKDMAFFKEVTTRIPKDFPIPAAEPTDIQNAVIMGRVTWESIPSKFRPLEARKNIVISRNTNYDLKTQHQTVKLVSSIEKAFEIIDPSRTPRIFVIGGAQIYREAIKHANCMSILLTRIRSKVDCDTFFPEIDNSLFRLASHEELENFVGEQVSEGVQTHKNLDYQFTMYVKR
ncbi:dihydrofolate reductase [Umbelopsis sp. PMI_123]|nr:dihydrofolate reductase [Umbelopsis sp. PMI_123]